MKIALSDLVVNPANDRHGKVANEELAIARLFHMRSAHMKKLAKDIVAVGEILEPPLVFPSDGKFVVADGNRRTASMKLLKNPKSAPDDELKSYFDKLRSEWKGQFPKKIECRVETDDELINRILLRRHTGTQGGIGQTQWDDRMKSNFMSRTGGASGRHIADDVEDLLQKKKRLPSGKIPRSTMLRLLSSEEMRNRVGISLKRGKFSLISPTADVIEILSRVASDLAAGRVVLGDLWNRKDKIAYLEQLESEGLGPNRKTKPTGSQTPTPAPSPSPSPTPSPKPTASENLIRAADFVVSWDGSTARIRDIWEELAFKLELTKHPNAIASLLRIVVELSLDHYIRKNPNAGVNAGDKLHQKLLKVAQSLESKGSIDKKYAGQIKRLASGDKLISVQTLHGYVHSIDSAPSPEHLRALWQQLSRITVCSLEDA